MTPVLTLSNVSKRFGRYTALDRLTASFSGGDIIGLVGPNGAGKTTALRIAAGLLRPSAGDVTRPTDDAISYFGGEHTLPPDVSARRWARLWRHHLAEGVPRRRFSGLSRGTRQRLGLEIALSSTAIELVLLDEPWESLDPDASRWLADQLLRQRAAGACVVVSSHRIHDLAAVCDRCEFLASGRITGTATCRAGAPLDERVESLLVGFDMARGARPQPAGVPS